jgi:hypothetical protein
LEFPGVGTIKHVRFSGFCPCRGALRGSERSSQKCDGFCKVWYMVQFCRAMERVSWIIVIIIRTLTTTSTTSTTITIVWVVTQIMPIVAECGCRVVSSWGKVWSVWVHRLVCWGHQSSLCSMGCQLLNSLNSASSDRILQHLAHNANESESSNILLRTCDSVSILGVHRRSGTERG